jgi:hypothetical protein
MRDETRPGQARGLGRRHVAVRRDDHHAFLPQLLEILGALWRSGLPDTCSGRPNADGQYSRRPGFVWFVLNPGGFPPDNVRKFSRSRCKYSTRVQTVLPHNVAWPFCLFFPSVAAMCLPP